MSVPDFFVDYKDVLNRIEKINPIEYARSRNFLNGHITYLSPFITHGIISTKTVADIVLKKHTTRDAEKLLAELGWREFFHRVWQARGDEIFDDLRNTQGKVLTGNLSKNIAEAETGVETLDESIKTLKETGYMHNHARMWTASVASNIAQTHWYNPSRWMYYHLLDGDLASNTLSWQWIVGSFSHKKYYANQENLNKYAQSKQTDTFLNINYDDFDTLEIPEALKERTKLSLSNNFPDSSTGAITENDQDILLYSIWNLDPTWRADHSGRRILWIDPDMHKDFPLSPNRWNFITHWAKQVADLEIFIGSQNELFPQGTENINIVTREYPATQAWPGIRDPRDWCYPNTKGYFKNFFSYWKLAQKEIPGLRKLHHPHKS